MVCCILCACPLGVSRDELSASLSALSVSGPAADAPSAASLLLSSVESLVDDWQSIELEEAEGRGARRDELHILLNDLVDELVASAVMEAKQRAPLSRHDRDEADALLSRTPPGSLIASAFNIDIRGRELSCLRRRQWLNDEVINMYLQLIEQRQNRKQSQQQTQHTSSRAIDATNPPAACLQHAVQLPYAACVSACVCWVCCGVDSASGGVSYLRCYYFNTSQQRTTHKQQHGVAPLVYSTVRSLLSPAR